MGRITETEIRLNWSRIFLITAIIFGAGAVGFDYFKPGGLSLFSEFGSVADWVAAAGTLMIGFGANKLARNSLELKFHEKRETRFKELNAKIDAFRFRTLGLTNWMSQVRIAQRMLDSYPFDLAQPNQVKEVLSEVINLTASAPWSAEDIARLDKDSVSRVIFAERQLGDVHAWIGVTIERISEADDNGLSELRVGELRGIAGILDGVVDATSKLVAQVEHEVQAYNVERARIAARLQRDSDDLLGK